MDVDRIKNACSETLVVNLLKEKPMHGYDMCKEIENRSSGYFVLKHSTLYPLLHRLEKEGLVKSKWSEFDAGKPRKYYYLTKKGVAHHEKTIESWRELVASIGHLIPEVAT
ncbi:MAG: hypothetical protein A2289_00625 [Deltaproteobacteria bacterium RIFOXYA12_FULL_58_15]|nr:MAG: hypothetical protein A2289_00625 [Deltaproteobacteria bacterium RIFOXYA12_FULL_58_15]OGR08578.1 MAG: hypothetical protein A2341_25360 [Deltaproteobacteria bacterium RIFOXYB12_FULL_58_9]